MRTVSLKFKDKCNIENYNYKYATKIEQIKTALNNNTRRILQVNDFPAQVTNAQATRQTCARGVI